MTDEMRDMAMFRPYWGCGVVAAVVNFVRHTCAAGPGCTHVQPAGIQ